MPDSASVGVTATRPRSAVTRQALLAAARQVFARDGYAETTIAAIVEIAGASVGSLYHHFNGKADIFLALYDAYETATWRAATDAVSSAKNAGEQSPVELFIVGARAYLGQCREDADLTVLFLDGDAPPGFEQRRREAASAWVRQNSRLVRADERRNGEALVNVLTTVVGAAGREVALADSPSRAAELIEDFCGLLRRVATPAPG